MKKMRWVSNVAVMLSLAIPCTALALPVTVLNSGFESTALNDGSYVFGAPSGWARTGNVGVYDPNAARFAEAVPEGENIAYLDGVSTLSQTLDFTVEANARLTLDVEVGWRSDYASRPAPIYEVQLWAGNLLLNAGSTRVDLTAGYFTLFSYEYLVGDSDPLIGSQVAIVLKHSGGAQVNFDAVSFTNDPQTAAVPEPGTLLLLGTGLLGLAVIRRKRLS